MIVYFADRAFNVLGLAGDKVKRGYNIENDEREIDVDSGIATFSFDIYYNDENRAEVEKITYVGNYILRKNGNRYESYTIIDTKQSTEDRSINVYAEDVGLDLINDVCLPFNYEIADFENDTNYLTGKSLTNGYIAENGGFSTDNNYRATDYIALQASPADTRPNALLFRVDKSDAVSRRYSIAFYSSRSYIDFIPDSGKYFYCEDSQQVSRVEVPDNAVYFRVSYHISFESEYVVKSSVCSYNISTYISTCISNSGFEIGLDEFGDIKHPIEFEEPQTASERIFDIADYFGAEISFSYIFDGLRIASKLINLHKRRGADNRVELRLGKDVKNIRVNRSVSELATAILAIGNTVNENGNQKIFTLQDYSGDLEEGYYIEDNKLCSRKAFAKWSRYLSASGRRSGHIVKQYDYDCDTQKTLYEYALADLKAIEDAEVVYEVDLYSIPPEVSLGDTVYIVDDLGEIYISARVLKIRESILNDTVSIELGDFVAKTSGIVDEWTKLRQQFAAWSEKNRPRYIWVAYADDNTGTGISLDPTDKEWMGMADNQTTELVDLSDPSIFNWIQLTAKDGQDGRDGRDGTDGADGVGVRSTTVSYAQSSAPNVMPGQNDWGSTIPNVPKGQVLWVRTVTDYTDNNVPDTVTYSYSIQGNDGQNGQNGANGVSVTVDSIEYVSWPTNQQPPDNASWQSTIPYVAPGNYLWTRTTFSDSNKAYGLARQGEDGTSVSIDNVSKVGDVTTVTFSDGNTISISDGTDGTNGTPGAPGTDGRPSYTHIAWANSSDGTVDFSTSVSTGKSYLGIYTDSTQADSSNPSSYNWSLIKGANGRDGTSVTITDISTSDGRTVITFSDNNQITINDGEDGLPGTPGTNGVSNYIHIAWANSADGTTDFSTSVSTNKKYFGTYKDTNATDSQSPSSYHWSLIKGADGTSVTVTKTEYKEGTSATSAPTGTWSTSVPSVAEGEYLWTRVTYSDNSVAYSVAKQGVSGTNGTNGTNGQDGTSVTVTSIAYAYQLSTSGTTVPTGTWKSSPQAPTTTQFAWTRTTTNFSDGHSAVTYTVGGKTGAPGQDGYSPTATVTKSGSTATITITDKNGTTTQTVTDGTNGTPGAPGADGRTSYFHVKYSNDGGSTFTGNSGEDLGKWIGTYTDFTQADSSSVSSYSWIKIEGEDGDDGADAYTIVLTNESHTFAATSDGKAIANQTAECQVIAYKGTTQIAATIGTISGKPTGLTTTISNNGTTSAKFTATTANTLTTKSGVLTVPITVDGKTFSKRFTYSLAVAGTSVSITSATKSGDTTTVVFSDNTQISIVDGADGQNGQPGAPGSNGLNSYVHIAWANSADGTTDFSTSVSTNKKYIGVYTDNTQADSSTPSDYSWSLIKGADGTRGSIWYSGTGITGTSTTATIFSGSGVSSAVVGDMYLNTSTYNTYRCTVAGNASTAKWVYVNNIKGTPGDPGTNGQDGDDGRGVSAIDREYYLSTSNSSQTGGSWSTTPAAYVSGRYYWYRDKIVWTNPTETTYTTAVLDNGLNSANSNAASAVSTANTASTNASNAVSTANAASTAAQNAITTVNETREWYAECSTAAATTAKVATITPATTDFTLRNGVSVNVKFTVTNSGAVGSLTLNVNDTGAKSIKYYNNSSIANLTAAGQLQANRVVKFIYDGTYWIASNLNYNTTTNYYDRRLHNNYLLALETITRYTFICGTAAGYRQVKANAIFDINYPILYMNTASIVSGSTFTAYEAMPDVNPTYTGTVEGAAVLKTLWLKVKHIAGSQFSVAETNFLTCVIPTTMDGYYYIPLGTYAQDATTKLYFASSDRLYGVIDITINEQTVQSLEFQPLDTAGILASRSFESTISTYKYEQDGIFAGITTDINAVQNDISNQQTAIDGASQRIETLTNELKAIYKVNETTGVEEGYLANVFSRINTIENNVQTAMSYMSEEGLNVEASNNPDTITTVTGAGVKVVSAADRTKTLMYVNNVQTMIRDVSIIGYLDVAGTSLSQKTETEYDGTSSSGLAFYN